MLLELTHICKAYLNPDGTRHQVLNNVSFSIARGEAVALTGPSGTGKSTLARIALGIDAPDSGQVKLTGPTLSGSPRTLGRKYFSKIQMVWQDPRAYLNPYLPAITLVTEPMLAFELDTRTRCREKAARLMESLGLDPSLGKRRTGQLSGGQCQRIAIARALSVSPQLLICDEALVSLDLVQQVAIIKFLKQVQKETMLSLLFITHDRASAQSLCTKELYLDGGRLLERGPDKVNKMFQAGAIKPDSELGMGAMFQAD